jgi:hypothetical protein
MHNQLQRHITMTLIFYIQFTLNKMIKKINQEKIK